VFRADFRVGLQPEVREARTGLAVLDLEEIVLRHVEAENHPLKAVAVVTPHLRLGPRLAHADDALFHIQPAAVPRQVDAVAPLIQADADELEGVVEVFDIDAFMEAYVSLMGLARERGLHFRALKSQLDAAGIVPAFEPEEVPATFYLRVRLDSGGD
jgi:hypothetical protein